MRKNYPRNLFREKVLQKRTKDRTIVEIIDGMVGYNGERLRAACHLLRDEYSERDVTIGVSLAGALTPAGLGPTVIGLMEHGFMDYGTLTGANAFHDFSLALGYPFYVGSAFADDEKLREKGWVRIYNISMNKTVLTDTDKTLRELFLRKEFQKEMSTSELHYNLGKHADKLERQNGLEGTSILAAAYRLGIPLFCPSPGDSGIGMNIAALRLGNKKFKLKINPSEDVTELSAIVYNATRRGKSGVFLLGGGAPKNFVMQTEPYLHEILRLEAKGHDYFIQFTTDRPDVGGLSGATPSEALTWDKIKKGQLEKAVVVYIDITVALPLVVEYVLKTTKAKKQKRLYAQREGLIRKLQEDYLKRSH